MAKLAVCWSVGLAGMDAAATQNRDRFVQGLARFLRFHIDAPKNS